jgi:hypothetical protein
MRTQNTSETFGTGQTTAAARTRESDHGSEQVAPIPIPDPVEWYFRAPAEPATPAEGKTLYAW